MATAQNPAVFAKNWRDLIKPKTLEIEKETLGGTYGKLADDLPASSFGDEGPARGHLLTVTAT